MIETKSVNLLMTSAGSFACVQGSRLFAGFPAANSVHLHLSACFPHETIAGVSDDDRRTTR